jgi:hypothetical protein
MNPTAPRIHVNWKNSPGYKLAIHLAKLLKQTIQLPNVFNVHSSEALIHNLKQTKVQGVLYGCETWSLAFWEELMVFENRMLRRILRPRRYEVTGGWQNLHDEELHILYSSPIKI